MFPSFKSENLSLKLKSFFHEIFSKLLIFFNLSDIKNSQILIDIEPITKKLSHEEKKKEEYSFADRCSFCESNCCNSISESKHSERIMNKYSASAMAYEINDPDFYKIDTRKTINITREFTQKFNEIKILGVLNQKFSINEQTLISKLNCLTCIRFENNNLEFLPESLSELESLMSLTIKLNPIKNFNLNLKKLKNLEYLCLENLSLNSNNFEQKIKLPDNLKSLSFNSMQFDDLPFEFENCKLSIRKLRFSSIKWFDLNKFTTIKFQQLAFFLSFYLDFGQINKLMAHFNQSKSGSLNKQEIIKLNAFIFKKFPRLTSFPQILFQMKNLTLLDLSNHAFKFIPNEIEQLENLSILLLKNCIYLESVSSKLGYLPIKELNLDGCLSLKTPPPEIVKRGTNSVLSYLKRLLSGTEICKRTKLMLVGLGEAGKTSLMNALITSDVSNKPEITDGIDIKNWSINLSDQSRLNFSIWDFGKI